MTTFEFKATVLSNGQIAVPSDVAAQIPAGREFQVILALEAPLGRDAFRLLGQKRFEESYAPDDSVYDSLA